MCKMYDVGFNNVPRGNDNGNSLRSMADSYHEILKCEEAWRKRQEKIDKIRNSEEYKTKLESTKNWLNDLDKTDSKPKDGRLDVSVFNAKVAKFGYEAAPDIVGYKPGTPFPIYSEDVNIDTQAQAMMDTYFGIRKKGD